MSVRSTQRRVPEVIFEFLQFSQFQRIPMILNASTQERGSEQTYRIKHRSLEGLRAAV